MSFFHNQTVRKILLTLILAWGFLTFYLQNSGVTTLIVLISIISLVGLVSIWRESSAIFILILMSFMVSYSFYIFLFQLALPVWIVMLAILLVFGYLFSYTEHRIGILGKKRTIYLVLFSLIVLEVFLVLSYFLINPISQSLIISAICYLFVGFCYTVLAKHTDNKFITYVIFTFISIVLVYLTSSWGGLV